MTGDNLHQLLITKWGYSYDVQLRRTQGKLFVQVMWRYLEQVSFPMSDSEYSQHLDAVASHINEWGVSQQVQTFIEQTRERPRLGKAVNIPVNLGPRASEWLLDDI